MTSKTALYFIPPNICHSHKYESHFPWLHFRSLPVVNVILEVTIADTKLEFLEKGAIFHNIQGIENVATAQFRHSEAIMHEFFERHSLRDVVKTVRCVQLLVFFVIN